MDMDMIMAGLDDQVRTNILILDACRNNPMAPQCLPPALPAASRPDRDSQRQRTLGAGATLGAGTLIAFATAPGQVALDGEGANQPVLGGSLVATSARRGLEVQQMLTRVRAGSRRSSTKSEAGALVELVAAG